MCLLLSRNVERFQAGDRFGYGYQEPNVATAEGCRLLRSNLRCVNKESPRNWTKTPSDTYFRWQTFPRVAYLAGWKRICHSSDEMWEFSADSFSIGAFRLPATFRFQAHPDSNQMALVGNITYQMKSECCKTDWSHLRRSLAKNSVDSQTLIYKGIGFESDPPAVWMQPICPILARHTVLVGCFARNQK